MMLTQGLIPRALHGLIEYVAGAFLVAAPFLVPYDGGASTAVSIVLGVLVLLIAASTEGPTSLANSIAIGFHVVLDYVLGGVLIAAPFVFGFSSEQPATAIFIGLGVIHLLVTVGTRFKKVEPQPEPAPDLSSDESRPVV